MSARAGVAAVALAALGVAGIVAGCGILPGTDPAAQGWPTAFPPPAGAPRPDRDEQALPAGGDIAVGCPLALISGIVIGTAADGSVTYTEEATHRQVRVVWQPGVSAWRTPTIVIVGPDGKVLAREGEPTSFGGATFAEGTYEACYSEYLPGIDR
jgi:hypothetical protein